MASIPKVSITSVTRSGYTFALNWKKAGKWKNSAGAKRDPLKYRIRLRINGNYTGDLIDVANSKTSYQTTVSASAYFPNTSTKLTSVGFGIFAVYTDWTVVWNPKRKRYERKYINKDGDYSVKDYVIALPGTPSVSATAADAADQTVYAWSRSDAANAIFTNYVRQTQLTENHASPNWNVSNNVTTGASYTATDTLDQSKSYTRWVRVKARGPAGETGWSQTYRIYAKPNAAIIDASSKATISGNNTTISMKWSQSTPAARPCSEMQPLYKIGTPSDSDLNPPSGSWTEFDKPYTKAGSKTCVTITDKPDVDELLWVAVQSTYLNRSEISAAKILSMDSAKLTAPSIDTVTKNDSAYTVTVTASNESDVPGSYMKVSYRAGSAMDKEIYLGTLTSDTATTFQCPDWSEEDSFRIEIKAVHDEGIYSDATVWTSGSVPAAPTNVAVTQSGESGTVAVTWTKAWSSAQEIEISWADNVLAWESNKEPESCTCDASAPVWYISDLETGVTWYFRARFLKTSGSDEVVGPWSEISSDATIDLSSAPSVPSLTLSKAAVYADEAFTASWGYVSNDGTAQAGAEICEATISGAAITYGDAIETTSAEQNITMYPETYEWEEGETHYLCVRVVSGSGRVSDWSAPVAISISEILPATISATSLETITVPAGDDTRTCLALTEMPLTVTITGAGEGATTRLVVERVGAYAATRPDGTKLISPDGETIYIFEQTGEDEISVEVDDLIGRFDDGATYKLVATVEDEYGKTSTAESDVFEVHWDHQAIDPTDYISVEMSEYAATLITVEEPEDYEEGDYIDIYRLSADGPELILTHGEFDTQYVDPYPAIGDMGGHRVVYLTSAGDYITDDDSYAWADLDADDGDSLDMDGSLIDFAGTQMLLRYNLALKNSWAKDIQVTSYLGGSIQGDWNPGIKRSGSLTGVLVTLEDENHIAQMRQLADHAGICHVRTPDGSSYAADIQVSEDRTHEDGGKIVKFTLNIQKVDTEPLDGMAFDDWDPEG